MLLRRFWFTLASVSLALGACAPAAVPETAPRPTDLPALVLPSATTVPLATPAFTAAFTAVPTSVPPTLAAPTATEFAFIQTFPTPDQFGFRRSDPADYRRISGRVQLVEFFSVY